MTGRRNRSGRCRAWNCAQGFIVTWRIVCKPMNCRRRSLESNNQQLTEWKRARYHVRTGSLSPGTRVLRRSPPFGGIPLWSMIWGGNTVCKLPVAISRPLHKDPTDWRMFPIRPSTFLWTQPMGLSVFTLKNVKFTLVTNKRCCCGVTRVESKPVVYAALQDPRATLSNCWLIL